MHLQKQDIKKQQIIFVNNTDISKQQNILHKTENKDNVNTVLYGQVFAKSPSSAKPI